MGKNAEKKRQTVRKYTMNLYRIRWALANPTLRHVLNSIVRNFAFKLFLVGFLILAVFSVAIFVTERSHVVYTTNEEGIRVEDPDRSSNIRTYEDSIWWAIVTSTTVGYGDYYPVSTAGRIIGILMMFFGIALVGVITGNIASALVEKQLKEGRGLKQLKLKNHFIICGWKRDMTAILHNIMKRNTEFLVSEIVLINMADQETIENLKADNEFKQINFIYGDYIDEQVLNRANIKQAKKVLVVADMLNCGSVQEVDSHTVMAVITIKAMSKMVYTCAEIIDPKFERYLRFSNCDEIVLTSEYNKSLIANASAGSGISHIINELLNVTSQVQVNTLDIPHEYVGKKYDELYGYLFKKDRTVLIGLLENTGNFYLRKRNALQEAQKTPDISKLVDNLKDVKSLVANYPVMNPNGNYEIKNYTKAIVIEGHGDGSSNN